MPLNVVLAAVGVLLVPERAPEPAAVAEVVEQVPAAPTKASSKRLVAYFLDNATAEAPDWYAYAVPMLIAHDLVRESPAFRVLTPFDVDSMLDEMRAAGFENAMRVPQSLQVKLAQQRRYSYFFRGELDDADNGGFVLRYALHDAASGEPRVVGEEAFDDSSLFAAVDRASAAIRDELRKNLSDSIQVTNLPVSESMSNDLDAIRLYTEARIVANIDVDGPRAGELLKAAIETDPQFAEAHGALGMYHYFDGRNDLAEASFEEALRYSFRLSRGTEFMLKMNKSAINGDFAGALDIARAWTRVEPGNESAHMELARLNAFTGQDFDEALRAYEMVRQLNPMAVGTLKASANLERQRGNVEAAEALLRQYVESEPDDAQGLTSLAQLQAAQGDYDDAISAYRQAAILDNLSVTPEVGVIGVLMRRVRAGRRPADAAAFARADAGATARGGHAGNDHVRAARPVHGSRVDPGRSRARDATRGRAADDDDPGQGAAHRPTIRGRSSMSWTRWPARCNNRGPTSSASTRPACWPRTTNAMRFSRRSRCWSDSPPVSPATATSSL